MLCFLNVLKGHIDFDAKLYEDRNRKRGYRTRMTGTKIK